MKGLFFVLIFLSNVQSQEVVFKVSDFICDTTLCNTCATAAEFYATSSSGEKIDSSSITLSAEVENIMVMEFTFPKPFSTDSMSFEGTFKEFNGVEMEMPHFSWTLEGVCVEKKDMGEGLIVSFVPSDGQNCGEAGKYALIWEFSVEKDDELFEMSGLNVLELITITDSSGNNFAKCTLQIGYS